jgi:polysaccharide biosynthesis protein PelA
MMRWTLRALRIGVAGLGMWGGVIQAQAPAPTLPDVPPSVAGAKSGPPVAQKGPVKRGVLIVYGADPKETEHRRVYPPDTLAALHLQTPLEYLGWEASFYEVTEPLPAIPLEARYGAVILDGNLKVPFAREMDFALWVLKLREQGVPLIFLGDIPLTGNESSRLLRQTLQIRGTLRPIFQPKELKIVGRDAEVMRGEIELKPSLQSFADLQAPPRSEIYLALTALDEHGAEVRYEPVFKAPWGGVLLDPYVARQFGANHISQLFDPYVFLPRLLPTPPYPVPDPTTRDGCRLLFSHIDGDGFTDLTAVATEAFNGEIIRDRILKKYAMPVTVSVIEAELRGHMRMQEPLMQKTYDERQADFTRVAKEIFTLPNVQAASHSYSHPFIWIPGDDDPVVIAKGDFNLKLKPEAKYPKIDPVREVKESLQWINQTLLTGTGKKCELMLWSGNTRPPGTALAAGRAAGVECLNGGNTIQSRRWPGRAGVAPRSTSMDGELQIYAPNQNEMYYTDDWRSTFLGGFALVRETFAMTETPRRLKPVNIYYHFYSAQRGDSLTALESVYDWAMAQPLQACTALDYVLMAKDSRETRIETEDATRWTIASQGACRTLRLPASLGYPEIGLDCGITGWFDTGDQRHIHTTGAKSVQLRVTPEPPIGPSVGRSELAVSAKVLRAEALELTLSGWRDGRLALRLPGGLSAWIVTTNDQPASFLPAPESSEAGLTWLTAAPGSTVRAKKK